MTAPSFSHFSLSNNILTKWGAIGKSFGIYCRLYCLLACLSLPPILEKEIGRVWKKRLTPKLSLKFSLKLTIQCHWKKLRHILKIVLPPCLSLTSPYLRERHRESNEEKIKPKIVHQIVLEIDIEIDLKMS